MTEKLEELLKPLGREAVEAARVLLQAPPWTGKEAWAVAEALASSGLSRSQALLLARALAEGNPPSLQALREAEGEGNPEAWREALRAPGEGLARLAEAPHLLALLKGARGAGSALGFLRPPPLPSPEVHLGRRGPKGEASPALEAMASPFPLGVVTGLPAPEALREAVRLALRVAGARGLGVQVGALTRLGAALAHRLLREAGEAHRLAVPVLPWEGEDWMERSGHLLFRPLVAGSADALLLGALRRPEAEARLLALAHKVAVLPVPLEWPRGLEALRALLSWMRLFRTGAVLYAPAVPKGVMEGLLEAAGHGGAPLPPPGVVLYGPEGPVLLREARFRKTPLEPGEGLEGFLREGGWLLLPSAEKAVEVYEALGKGGTLLRKEGRPYARKLPDGRSLLLYHGRLRVGVGLAREALEAHLVVGTAASLRERLPRKPLHLENPSPLLLLEAALAGRKVAWRFPEPFPRRLPKVFYEEARSLAARHQEGGKLLWEEVARLLDGDAWREWAAERAKSVAPLLLLPSAWPGTSVPQGRLREAEGVLLVGEDLEPLEGVALPAYLAAEKVETLWERGWVLGVRGKPGDEEKGLP